MLTLAELSEARTDYAQIFLVDRCTIRRAEPGISDAYGGRSQRKSTVYTGTPCKIQRAQRPQVVESGYQNVALHEWEVCLPVGTKVMLADSIEVAGASYEVKGTSEGTSEALVLIAYCTRTN